MTYIITEPCIGTKDGACVDVCPVDCIHPRKDEPEFAAVHPSGRMHRLRRLRAGVPGRSHLRW
jgi:NAD-dependent dihydropyrimidine dehydrogenase PreA subunit